MSDLYTTQELLRFRGKKIKVIEATKTATGNTQTTPIDISPFKEANFFLNVSAKSGTNPTLDVVVKTKDPGADKWHTIATFTQATDVTSEMKVVAANLGEKISITYTIGGTTPSFTFSVYGWVKI